MSPRPILKQRSSGPSTGPSSHLAVHFPPSPSLTTHTFAVYSASAYDRSPIVVSPNSCALPARGCPGRTYTLDDPAPAPSPSTAKPKRGHPYGGRDLHPRALATTSFLPLLIPDLSSESDESDGFASPPLDSDSAAPYQHTHGLAIPYPPYAPYDLVMYGSPAALSFLPHPPSYANSYTHHDPPVDEAQSPKPRRRKERKHEPSRTPDRIPSGSVDGEESTTPTKSRKTRVCGFSQTIAARHAASGFRVEDDGCLGGF
jgi:hypothetical protein